MTLKQNPNEEYEIVKHLGTVCEKNKGKHIHRKELNLISYGGGRPVYDLRTWEIEKKDFTNVTMKEGITLSKADMKTLLAIIEKEVFPND